MHAEQIAEDYPPVTVDSIALQAARLLAEHRLPGLVVTDRVIRGRFCRPHRWCGFDAQLSAGGSVTGRVLSESMADRIAETLGGKRVGKLIPAEAPELAVVNADISSVVTQSILGIAAGHMRGCWTNARLEKENPEALSQARPLAVAPDHALRRPFEQRPLTIPRHGLEARGVGHDGHDPA